MLIIEMVSGHLTYVNTKDLNADMIAVWNLLK